MIPPDTCRAVYEADGIQIIECKGNDGKENFFGISKGKRFKIGMVEGEIRRDIACSCRN